MTNFEMLLVDPAREIFMKVAGFIPTLGGTLLVLVIGMIAAKVIKEMIGRLFKVVKLDYLTDEIGIGAAIEKSGAKHKLSGLLTTLLYWIVLVITLIATVNALGVPGVYGAMDRLLAYVPHVILAAFILVLGLVVAHFVAGMIDAVIRGMDLPEPEFIAKIAKWAILLFAVTASLEELGFMSLFVGLTSDIFFGGIVLALALAFGLGGRDAASRFLDDVRKKH